MAARRPPRREGPHRPDGSGKGRRGKPPGSKRPAGNGPRPPRREAQGSKSPARPGPRPVRREAHGSKSPSRPGPRPVRRESHGPKPPSRPGSRPQAGPPPRDRRPVGPDRPAGPRRDPGPRPATDARPVAPRRDAVASEPDRLQKVLAHAGVGSRRSCEEFILQGRISINGKIVRELGTKVVAGRDKIAVDGQPIHDERPVYIAVNKPKGYVSTNNDPSGRPRVVDLVPNIPQRVYSVGRLDEMSTGLMLLTNDGELANRLAHPKFGVEKVYRAVVAGTPANEVYQKLVEGVWLAEGKVRAKRVKPIAHKGDATVLELVLAEGKNREVRRMLAKFGHKVMTLTRVAVGPVTMKGLKPGGWRFLTAQEVDLLRKVADGMPTPASRFGGERTLKAPMRGPRAAQHGPPSGPSRPPAAGDRKPPSGPRSNSGPPQQSRRPAPPSSGPFRREAEHVPRPPRDSQGSGHGPPSGPRPREPFVAQSQGPPPSGPRQRPPSGPPQRPTGGAPLSGPRPRGPSVPQSGGPPPSGPRQRPPSGPAPRPPSGPPRDQPLSRRIIGMEFQPHQSLPPPPEDRRPPPRPRPGGPPTRRPGPLPRRPRGPNDGES